MDNNNKLWSKFSIFLIILMALNFLTLIIFEDIIFNSEYISEYIVFGLLITCFGVISSILHVYFKISKKVLNKKSSSNSQKNIDFKKIKINSIFSASIYNIYLYSYSIVIIVFLLYLIIYEIFLKDKSEIYLYFLILVFGILIGYSFAYKSFKYFEKNEKKDNIS